MWLFMRVILHVVVHAGGITCVYSCMIGYIYIYDLCIAGNVLLHSYMCVCDYLTQYSERTVCWFCSQVSSGC